MRKTTNMVYQLIHKILLVPPLIVLMLGVFSLGVFAGGMNQSVNRQGTRNRLILATTTSTENSGLLSHLLPYFEQEYQVTVNIIALGTGQALQLGRSGDADILMVHAPDLEEEFMSQGYGITRRTFMYNDFVILGPSTDPAGVLTSQSLHEAMRNIANSNIPFISRGDSSGTHSKELSLWYNAGITSTPDQAPVGSWYQEVGQGMGTVISVTQNRNGYTLSDRSTFLSYQGPLDLQIVYEGDEILYNPYSLIIINPDRHPHVNAEFSYAFLQFITSDEGRRSISSFQLNGQQLFFPVSYELETP